MGGRSEWPSFWVRLAHPSACRPSPHPRPTPGGFSFWLLSPHHHPRGRTHRYSWGSGFGCPARVHAQQEHRNPNVREQARLCLGGCTTFPGWGELQECGVLPGKKMPLCGGLGESCSWPPAPRRHPVCPPGSAAPAPATCPQLLCSAFPAARLLWPRALWPGPHGGARAPTQVGVQMLPGRVPQPHASWFP